MITLPLIHFVLLFYEVSQSTQSFFSKVSDNRTRYGSNRNQDSITREITKVK